MFGCESKRFVLVSRDGYWNWRADFIAFKLKRIELLTKPIGGAGFAFPEGTCNLMMPRISFVLFDMILFDKWYEAS